MKHRRPSAGVRIRIALLLTLASLGVESCREKRMPALTMESPRESSVLQPAEAAGKPQVAARPSRNAALEAVQASRKLIRTGEISIEVQSYERAAQQAVTIAKLHGGYVADSRVGRGAGDKQRGSLTLRVRADRFEEAFRALKALGKVESESVSTQDITKAYSDLETRLRVKREAEARMREILRTKTAKLSDVIDAEKALTQLIEEIEQMEGERRYYDQQVALSTISAELHEKESIARESAFSPLRKALHDCLGVLSSSLAALIYATVFAIPWIVLAWLLWRLRRRLRARRQARQDQRP